MFNVLSQVLAHIMENFLLCGELGIPQDQATYSTAQLHSGVYKGRKKGTVEFVGIWKYGKREKEYVENGVRISHPLDNKNVLKFCEWYETPEHIWVITELAVGGSLKDILEQDGFISTSELPSFIKDIAAGLNYIHSRGVIYCDLQPSKIVLDSCQNLKLSDFTLARQADECQNPHDFKSIVSSLIELKKATRLALIDNSALAHAPSPFYCAPELFELSTNFTITTDLWSLGCVVYELSLGTKPFDSDDPKDLVHSICFDEISAIVSHLQTSPEIVQLVSQLLSRTPSNRYVLDGFLQ